MSEMKRIKIEESEGKARQLLAAVRRLEKKFPELKEFPSGASAVRQRFEAICKPVKLENLDRRGSLIGGTPFLSPEYPEPESDEASFEGRQHSVGMAPLAQLDLDQISESVGESLGSGLLQVWMRPGLWGQQPFIGDLEIRLVPRDVVDNTVELLDSSIEEDEDWITEKAAELEVLRIVDPNRAEMNDEIDKDHYWSGVDGLDWTLSKFSRYENWRSFGRFGAPQQIIGWQPAGYTLPPTYIGPSIWNLPDDFEDRFPALSDDPDYKIVCAILGASFEHPKCALFDIYYGFNNPLYGSELYDDGDSMSWNWRPLFAFPGPLSDCLSDEHVVFYRESDGGFEYAGASMRWS